MSIVKRCSLLEISHTVDMRPLRTYEAFHGRAISKIQRRKDCLLFLRYAFSWRVVMMFVKITIDQRCHLNRTEVQITSMDPSASAARRPLTSAAGISWHPVMRGPQIKVIKKSFLSFKELIGSGVRAICSPWIHDL